jgi:hypothetical protein
VIAPVADGPHLSPVTGSLVQGDRTDDLARHPCSHHVGRNVPRHHSQVDDGVISDRDTLVDVNAYTDPDAIANADWLCVASSERPLAGID